MKQRMFKDKLAENRVTYGAGLRARSRELLAKSTALMAQSDARAVDSENNIVQFLKTDLKVGLTLARIALQGRNSAERQRNRRSARIAYNTVLQSFERMHLSDTDAAEIGSRAAELKSALEKLGESV